MQLVCYIDRRDFPLLQQKSGYWKSDARADDIRRFLEAVGNVYVTPFVCMGVLPDGADPDDSSHALHVFGDTPLILRASLANEVRLACVGDVQTTAVNGLARRNPAEISALYRRTMVDLTSASADERRACVDRLSSHFDNRGYPEVRIYRTITWDDVEPQCRQALQSQEENPGDILLGPDFA